MGIKYWVKNKWSKRKYKKWESSLAFNKEDIKDYEDYYTKTYKYYNGIKDMNNIRNIEIEQSRLRGQLEKNNNPGIAFYIAISAAIFSTICTFTFDNLKSSIPGMTTHYQLGFIVVLILVGIVSSYVAIYQRDNIGFYVAALDVLEDMKKKKLRERKYKKRR
ncbi:hypothetical protein REK96_006175 [Clostridioides difficile]|uniref:hypothetical protein n=1 Tax=Clostridioides difficile TaxID=1496 RepID=UPI00287CC4DF|nr:hypothetical protein [Clostridioides difficile]KAK2236443.1 hypothetical protein XC29_19695 [Clostridioides difficile]KAK2241138.1 hypothetical protein XC29_11110 [Clostridioides difficile]KAK2245205.1 hypothetical protein XC29_00780 [Clostridioides difficile]MDS6234818.1 hypothetical protein [Clostridioides difficile]